MTKLCFGNWKLHKNPKNTQFFLDKLSLEIKNQSLPLEDFALFPQALSAFVFSDQEEVLWGAQNIYTETEGPYTGENSAQAYKDMGARYILIGHSERRTLFSETNQDIQKKISLTQSLDLKPVLCIGESLEDRQNSMTFKVLEKQLEEALEDVDLSRLIIAYEPVWAIGTGRSATSKEVSEVHRWLRDSLKKKTDAEVPLLYGGSVKPENAQELFEVDDVNGFLIGGASLKVESFLEIYKNMGV